MQVREGLQQRRSKNIHQMYQYTLVNRCDMVFVRSASNRYGGAVQGALESASGACNNGNSERKGE